jgi:hypothetical protein
MARGLLSRFFLLGQKAIRVKDYQSAGFKGRRARTHDPEIPGSGQVIDLARPYVPVHPASAGSDGRACASYTGCVCD